MLTETCGPVYFTRSGGGEVGSQVDFWGVLGGGGGVGTKEKFPDFRCPEVGISGECMVPGLRNCLE